LRNGKFWFDLATGEFASRDMSDKMTAKLVERITEAAEELAAKDAEVETATKEAAAPATEAPAKAAPVADKAASDATAGIGVRTAVGPGLPPGTKVYTNRKPGYCRRCGKLVPAGAGYLYY